MATYDAGYWRKLRLENFRRFEDTELVELRPITLFLGKNSSGKTSLLRSLLLAKQLILTGSGTDVPLAGPEADFGSYKDLVHGGEMRRDVRLSFGVNVRSRRRIQGQVQDLQHYEPILQDTKIEIVMHWNARAARAQVDRLRISSMSQPDLAIQLDRHGPNEFTLQGTTASKRVVRQPLSLTSLRLYPLWMGMERSPRSRQSQREREQGVFRFTAEEYAVFLLMQELVPAAESIVHIGPLREMPSRAYRVDQLAPSGSTASVVEVFSRERQAQRRVSAAIGSMGMARDVSLVQLAPGYVGIVLTDSRTGRVDNLADVGFGVSQVLPILVTLTTARMNSTVLIEQPELHLHPDAQGQLADVMIALSKERKTTLVMETHSEHIMLRLQRRIAEGSLFPSDVAIYVVDNGKVRLIPLDDAGRLDMDAMPHGFFEEEWEDALKLAKAAAAAKSSA